MTDSSRSHPNTGRRTLKTVLTIAGFDPSSGAGVTADLMVFAAHHLFGTACITALTVQNTTGVFSSHPIDPGIVADTLDRIEQDLPPDGIKLGMLPNREVVLAVAGFLARVAGQRSIPVVLDPVLRSSSGRDLVDHGAVKALREDLLPLVTWVTPNVAELGVLSDQPIGGRNDLPAAAHSLRNLYPHLKIVATGGHLESPDDLVLAGPDELIWLPGTHIESSCTHGTGCSYSSALLSKLVHGEAPVSAARSAKLYVAEAIRSATPLGHGRGPLNHLWTMDGRAAKGELQRELVRLKR